MTVAARTAAGRARQDEFRKPRGGAFPVVLRLLGVAAQHDDDRPCAAAAGDGGDVGGAGGDGAALTQDSCQGSCGAAASRALVVLDREHSFFCGDRTGLSSMGAGGFPVTVPDDDAGFARAAGLRFFGDRAFFMPGGPGAAAETADDRVGRRAAAPLSTSQWQ
jgi:hypothetical protein